MRLNKPSLRVDSVAFSAGHNQVASPRQFAFRKQMLGAVVLAFREDATTVIAHDQVGFLARIAVDDTGSEHVDAVATSKPIGDLQDAVGGFREGVRQPGVEVGEHLFMPVIDRSTELDELWDVRELDLPFLKSPFCGGAAGAVPDVVERLFRFPRSLQRGRVGQPAVKDELRTRRQPMPALLKEEATFHRRSLRLHRGELTSGGDAYRVKMFVCGSDDVEFVHDDNGLRKVDRSQVSVRAPHVHGQVADTFTAGQMRHPVTDTGLAVGLQQIEDLASEHVDQDSTQSVRQVYLVDAENLRGIEVPFFQQFRDVLALDVSARLLVNANVAGNVQGRTNEGLHGDVVVAPQRHAPVGGHVRKALEEGLSAFPALEALHRNVDHGLFSVDRSVNVFGFLWPVTDETADDTALRTSLRNDVVAGLDVIPFVNLHVGHRPVRKIQCIVRHGRPFGATHTAFGLTCGVWLHKHEPMGLCRFPAAISNERLLVGQAQKLGNLHLMLVPLEDQRSERLEDTEAFGKSSANIIAPVLTELAVLLRKPSVLSVLHQVRRVEDDQVECLWRVRKVAEVKHLIRVNDELTGAAGTGLIREAVFLAPDVSENGSVIVPVEPEHAATAAHVNHWLFQFRASFIHTLIRNQDSTCHGQIHTLFRKAVDQTMALLLFQSLQQVVEVGVFRDCQHLVFGHRNDRRDALGLSPAGGDGILNNSQDCVFHCFLRIKEAVRVVRRSGWRLDSHG